MKQLFTHVVLETRPIPAGQEVSRPVTLSRHPGLAAALAAAERHRQQIVFSAGVINVHEAAAGRAGRWCGQ